MRRFLIVLALSLGLFATPPLEAQDSRTWTGLCTPGAMHACASITVHLLYDPFLFPTLPNPEGTSVTLEYSNLQGNQGPVPDPGPNGIQAVSVQNLFRADPTPLFEFPLIRTPVGAATVYGSDYHLNAVGDGATLFTHVYLPNYMTWGCDQLAPNYFAGTSFDIGSTQYGWTCGGSIQSTVALRGVVAFTPTTTVGFSSSFYPTANDRIGVSCTAGVDCLTIPTTAVPEPSTWVMLASGMLGLVFVARRRREDEVSE